MLLVLSWVSPPASSQVCTGGDFVCSYTTGTISGSSPGGVCNSFESTFGDPCDNNPDPNCVPANYESEVEPAPTPGFWSCGVRDTERPNSGIIGSVTIGQVCCGTNPCESGAGDRVNGSFSAGGTACHNGCQHSAGPASVQFAGSDAVTSSWSQGTTQCTGFDELDPPTTEVGGSTGDMLCVDATTGENVCVDVDSGPSLDSFEIDGDRFGLSEVSGSGDCDEGGGGFVCDGELSTSPPLPDDGDPGDVAQADMTVSNSESSAEFFGSTTISNSSFDPGTVPDPDPDPDPGGGGDPGPGDNSDIVAAIDGLGDGLEGALQDILDELEDDEGTATGGTGNCLTSPTCSGGDPTLCAILIQEWELSCEGLSVEDAAASAAGDLDVSASLGELAANQDADIGGFGDLAEGGDRYFELDVADGFSGVTDSIGGSCIDDLSFSYRGSTITFEFSKWCPLMTSVGYLVAAFAALLYFQIVRSAF